MPDVPVFIVSHKRADSVRSAHVVAGAKLCIPVGQLAEYEAADYGIEIVTHPDEVVGLSPKRNWMLDTYGDHFVMDDDIKGLRRIYDQDLEPHLSPDDAYEAIQATAYVARQVGAKLWGFSNYPMTYTYDVFKPFKTTGYVNGMSFGIFADSKLRFPDDPHSVVEDFWVSAINAFHHRYIWQDTRFAFEQVKTFRQIGGVSDYRTMDKEREDYEMLVRYFGDAIQLKRRGGRPPDTSVERMSASAGHPFEKTLRVPW